MWVTAWGRLRGPPSLSLCTCSIRAISFQGFHRQHNNSTVESPQHMLRFAMIIVLFLAAISATILSKLLNLHTVHSRLWGCKQRTNTQHRTRFNLSRFYVAHKNVNYVLSRKDVVTFDFKLAEPDIFIEIPQESQWASPYHTHITRKMCVSLDTLSGRWYIGGSSWPRRELWGPQLPEFWISFGKDLTSSQPATAKLLGSERTRQLYHIICSSVEDAEVYFSLCSTPLWVRVLYVLTNRTPSLREWMIHKCLWIQLRTTFHKYDFCEDHGTCWILRQFYWMNVPEWVKEFERWSQFAISRVVLSLNYWIGSIALGMRPSYEEYKLVDSQAK